MGMTLSKDQAISEIKSRLRDVEFVEMEIESSLVAALPAGQKVVRTITIISEEPVE